VELYWQGKTEGLGEKSVPVLLCPPQIPHGLTCEWTQASAERSRRLTAWNGRDMVLSHRTVFTTCEIRTGSPQFLLFLVLQQRKKPMYALCVTRSPDSLTPLYHLYLLYTWTFPQRTCMACINTTYVIMLSRGLTANGISHLARNFLTTPTTGGVFCVPSTELSGKS
jgi:hypothetical protein